MRQLKINYYFCARTRQPWATKPFCEKERAQMKQLQIIGENEWLSKAFMKLRTLSLIQSVIQIFEAGF